LTGKVLVFGGGLAITGAACLLLFMLFNGGLELLNSHLVAIALSDHVYVVFVRSDASAPPCRRHCSGEIHDVDEYS
jgi:hypothetical protein